MTELCFDFDNATGEKYPFRPGRKENSTSRLAAESIASRAETLRDAALEVIRTMPRTADEVASIIGESVLAVRPRIAELHKMRKIRATGQRRENQSGQSAHVWEVSGV